MMIEAWVLFFRGVPARTPSALLYAFLMLTTVGMVADLLQGERSGEFYRAGPSTTPHAKSK